MFMQVTSFGPICVAYETYNAVVSLDIYNSITSELKKTGDFRNAYAGTHIRAVAETLLSIYRSPCGLSQHVAIVTLLHGFCMFSVEM